MLILNVNVNDFGGIREHREEYKKIYGNSYIREWDKLDKTLATTKMLNFIKKEKPKVVVLQEFDFNSIEARDFIDNMEEYEVVHELPSKRPSMTVMFVKKDITYKKIDSPHNRNLRACVIEIDGYIIYGTHIPVHYDEEFWNEIYKFYQTYKNKKLALIGDFNTVNIKNKEKYEKLISNGAIDAWVEKGNSNDVETVKDCGRLDYVVMTNSMYQDLKDIQIKPQLIDKGITDHAALIINMK